VCGELDKFAQAWRARGKGGCHKSGQSFTGEQQGGKRGVRRATAFPLFSSLDLSRD
jgi:hypothetical protein